MCLEVVVKGFCFSDFPVFDSYLIEQCNESRDYRPLLFEWYKYVGINCNSVASISGDSPALRAVPKVHYAVLVGLLNRCSRLMLSNIALSSNGKFGETTRIIDRCISESALLVMWLCRELDSDYFTRYLADGLRSDLRLKAQIVKNIAGRNGVCLVIEERMLRSIDEKLKSSQLSTKEIEDAKQFPDLASIISKVDLDENAYTAIQRMGSHAIHGTWTDLNVCYLKKNPEGYFTLRDHDMQMHHNQYVAVSFLVLDAMRQFLEALAVEQCYICDLLSVLDEVRGEIYRIDKLDRGIDFDPVREGT